MVPRMPKAALSADAGAFGNEMLVIAKSITKMPTKTRPAVGREQESKGAFVLLVDEA
jgi:hypothetical protein